MDPKGINVISRAFSAHSTATTVGQDTPWIQYFRVYFKFGYFTFVSPHHFRYQQSEGQYKLVSFPMQKAICGFVQFLSVLVLITDFRIIRAQDLKKNPVLYIELASLALNTWYQLGVLYIFWFKMSFFTRFFNELRTTALTQLARGDIFRMKLLSLAICTVAFLQAIISFMYGVEDKTWELSRFLDTMARRGKYMFFMGPGTRLNGVETVLVTFLYFLASFYSQLMKNMADIVGLLSVLFFRHVLYDMLAALRDESFTTQQLQICYDALKSLLLKLNRAVGYFIFFFFLGPVPYYAINIVTMLDASDALLLGSNLIYLINYLFTIILAARVNIKSEEIKDWLTAEGRYTEISPPKLDLILHDITEYELALSGYGFFSASSALVGAIVSLILTYAILVVQFQAVGPEEAGKGGNHTLVSSLTEATAMLMNRTVFRLR